MKDHRSFYEYELNVKDVGDQDRKRISSCSPADIQTFSFRKVLIVILSYYSLSQVNNQCFFSVHSNIIISSSLNFFNFHRFTDRALSRFS